MTARKRALAIDIGGSKLMAAIVDRQGQMEGILRRDWAPQSADDVTRGMVAVARQVLDATGQTPDLVGVAIPGLTDPWAGYWREASFSGIGDIPVARRMEEALSLPCYIENDGTACAWAEKLYGAAQDVDDFIYVTVSNGIGGGAFTGGRPLYGADGNAMELGHITVLEGGRACGCGSTGCLEMHAAGPGLVRNYVEMGGPAKMDGAPVTAKSIAALAKQGDATAVQAYEMTGRYLGTALAAACNLLNPRRIIIGGGLSLDFPLFAPALEQTLRDNIYTKASGDLTILPTPLGYNGALLGAAAVAFARQENLMDINGALARVFGREQA